MAGFIIACGRAQERRRHPPEQLERAAVHVTPPDITAHPPRIAEEHGVACAVINPVAGVASDAHGVCLGMLFGGDDWSTPGQPPPGGSFALARYDDDAVELVTDAFASRTIWYAFDDDAFVASTSQRAIAALLGDFRPHPETVSWLVTSGYLGPERGWDTRVRKLGFGTCLRLDRRSWTISTSSRRIEYHTAPGSEDEHIARLREAVFTACRDLDLAGRRWVLPISGGHDSRALLAGLVEAGHRPDCITWGLAESLSQPFNDAYIGRQLADRFDLQHEYRELDPTGEPMRDVLTRFLLAGEGRAVDFSGYTDGMRTWKDLFDAGVDTVLRGDTPGLGSGQGRSYDPVSEFVVRTMIGRAPVVEDFPEGHLVRRLGLASQEFPAGLRLQPGEGLGFYRDRIHNEYKVGTMFAALNDPKCAYVDVVNPLFHPAVIKAVSELPDELRLWERGYATMVEGLVPGIPFDKYHAEAQADDYLAWPAMLDELTAELSTRPRPDMLPRGARELLLAELRQPTGAARRRIGVRQMVKGALPYRVLRSIPPRLTVDSREAAFRAYAASRMGPILADDAAAGRAG